MNKTRSLIASLGITFVMLSSLGVVTASPASADVARPDCMRTSGQ